MSNESTKLSNDRVKHKLTSVQRKLLNLKSFEERFRSNHMGITKKVTLGNSKNRQNLTDDFNVSKAIRNYGNMRKSLGLRPQIKQSDEKSQPNILDTIKMEISAASNASSLSEIPTFSLNEIFSKGQATNRNNMKKPPGSRLQTAHPDEKSQPNISNIVKKIEISTPLNVSSLSEIPTFSMSEIFSKGQTRNLPKEFDDVIQNLKINSFHFDKTWNNSSADFHSTVENFCAVDENEKTVAIQYKLYEQDIQAVLTRLKIGISIYGCNFKKISEILWSSVDRIPPNVLYQLFRQYIIKD